MPGIWGHLMGKQSPDWEPRRPALGQLRLGDESVPERASGLFCRKRWTEQEDIGEAPGLGFASLTRRRNPRGERTSDQPVSEPMGTLGPWVEPRPGLRGPAWGLAGLRGALPVCNPRE